MKFGVGSALRDHRPGRGRKGTRSSPSSCFFVYFVVRENSPRRARRICRAAGAVRGLALAEGLSAKIGPGEGRSPRKGSALVLELRLGVERLRRRGGDQRGRGRRRGASGEAGQNGAGDDGAKTFGHQRGLLIIRQGSGSRREQRHSVAEKPDFNPSYPPAQDRRAPRNRSVMRNHSSARRAALTPAPPRDGSAPLRPAEARPPALAPSN